ncbi:MAG TPA: membrane protein insertase YidC [Verrucomicrobiae bacterium]|nr:membrane protein insertase YidC [Verrucomicrobiae bacterium]
MDRKSIIILVLCGVLIVFWPALMRRLYPPAPVSTNQVAAVTGTNTTYTNNATNAIVTSTSITNTSSTFVVNSSAPEQLLVVTNTNARYTFTSRGGGLQLVELVGYPETVSTVRRKKGQTNQWATLNAPTMPPLLAVLGDESLQGDNIYKLSEITNGVRAEKSLPNGLTIVKDFQLGTNYLVSASVRLENHSRRELTIPPYQWSAGTAAPMSPQDNGMAEMVQWFNGSKAASVALSYFNTNTSSFFGLMSRTPHTEYVEGSNNVVWSSAQNQFFVIATMPDKPAQAVVVHMVDLPPPTEDELKDSPNAIRNPHGLESALIYPGLKLAPGGVAASQFIVFAGPKEYQTLAALAARFNNEIDRVMNFGWSGPISKVLLVAMNWIHHSLGLPYGWTIIFITIFLKVVFWPLTQASTRSAKRMQELQPQLKALQEKYKDDPQKLPAKQWEFYKKNNINPMAGCLPMLLQVPVFIGFYGMLRTAIELRGAPFLWIGDLSKPDTVLSLHLPLHYLGFSDLFFPVNPMPLIMGATLLWQARSAPVSPGMDPSQQKMMKYMPLMMLVFMYNLSSGLAVYWTVNNMLTIVQTKLTKTRAQTAPAVPAKAPASLAPQKKKK